MSDFTERKWREERQEKQKDRQGALRNALIATAVSLLAPVVTWGLGFITNKGEGNIIQNIVTGTSVVGHAISVTQPVLKVADESRSASLFTKKVQDENTPAHVLPGPDEAMIQQLQTSLGNSNPDIREAAALDAITKTKEGAARLLVLRTIYRTNDPTLRSMAVLYELKSLEGKQIPLSFLPDAGTKNADSGAPQSDNSLATWLIGSSLAIKAVDLTSGTFSGSYLSSHGLPRDFTGSVTNDGLRFSVVVDLGPNNPLPLQVSVRPEEDFKLSGIALGVTPAGKQMETPIVVPLPQ